MELGLQTAFREITLVFFTTLAPSGALAFVLMALPLIFSWAAPDVRAKFNKFLCVPLLVSMVGLVASATHLGNPSNALYVFLGVGQSPLSNEVFFAVVFLALGGLYWLYTFTLKPSPVLSRLWLCLASAAALGFIAAVCFAYDDRTVITWQLPTGPLSVVANALLGAPLIALASLAWIGKKSAPKRYDQLLLALAAIMVVVNAAIYAWQWFVIGDLANSRVTALSLVPQYWLYWGAFVVIEMVAVGLAARMLKRGAVAMPPQMSTKALARFVVPGKLTLATVLSLSGIFIMRFVFYMLHMTVGLGV